MYLKGRREHRSFQFISRGRLGWKTQAWGPFLESPEKPFVKLWLPYSLKLVFSYVVNEIQIKVTAKFRASKRLRFEDTKSCLEVDV